MSENNIKSRIQLKNDTEANWLKAVNFTPKAGEIIVYNVDDTHDRQRIKIGDGEKNINDLPFLEKEIAQATAEAAGIMKLYDKVGEATDGTMTQNAIETLKANKPLIINATIPAIGWSSDEIKTITAEATGIKSTDTPIADVKLPDDVEQKLKILDAWALIIKITANDDTIAVEAVDVPEVAIPINLFIIR